MPESETCIFDEEATVKHIYGPVPSRRLGASLGVDIVPYKVCSFDCIYCQLGRTTRMSRTPEVLVDTDEVMRELEQWLNNGQSADYITFAGSGEPTMHFDLGRMISGTKRLTDIPVAVITNGSLFSDPSVRKAVAEADLVVPSLDAGCEDTFIKINRPHQELTFDEVIGGLIALSEDYANEIRLEVMLVDGINDSDEELSLMRDIIYQIAPDKVQVNTVDRPSRSGDAVAVCQDRLFDAARMLYPGSEVIVNDLSIPAVESSLVSEEDLLELLRRRPCRMNDICLALGFHTHEATKILRKLVDDRVVIYVDESTDPFYQLACPNYRRSYDV